MTKTEKKTHYATDSFMLSGIGSFVGGDEVTGLSPAQEKHLLDRKLISTTRPKSKKELVKEANAATGTTVQPPQGTKPPREAGPKRTARAIVKKAAKTVGDVTLPVRTKKGAPENKAIDEKRAARRGGQNKAE